MTRNRLAKEKSPYLLQHAENPVHWQPWGEEAFERAQKEDKPVFLSIGYSTCHWCHVMESESFEDEEVATILNQGFVSIKVDREERPEIDQLYMTVCQLATGSGGWPLTIIMTPDKRPFFATTYIPKNARFQRPGLLQILPGVLDAWHSMRGELLQTAGQLVSALKRAARSGRERAGGLHAEIGAGRGEELLLKCYRELKKSFDARSGGFGEKPKFPAPHKLLFLLEFHKLTGEEEALNMVTHTLEQMRLGGIYDHIGFGFHRYSTDREWLLPHFEKMLYDQALHIMAYTRAWQATGNEEFKRTAEEIVTYLLRELRDQEGGFHSAEDADSEGEEGKFYLWSQKEAEQFLGKEKAELFTRLFNFQKEGNFLEEATGKRTGTNILHLKHSLEESAEEMKISPEELRELVESCRKELFIQRELRTRPGKDDKVLTDWNGLAIAALSEAGFAFNRPDYIEAAKKAADFILENLRTPKGRLLHRYRDKEAGIFGTLHDFAFFIQGLLKFYQAYFKPSYLKAALELQKLQIEHFRDEKYGGFYLSPDDGEELLVRQKEIYDSAIPSGNAVTLQNLLTLARLTGKHEFEEEAGRLLEAFWEDVANQPSSHSHFMSGILRAFTPSQEIVLVGSLEEERTEKLLGVLRRKFLPGTVLLVRVPGVEELVPFVAEYGLVEGKSVAYVCKGGTCERPVVGVEEFEEFL